MAIASVSHPYMICSTAMEHALVHIIIFEKVGLLPEIIFKLIFLWESYYPCTQIQGLRLSQQKA